MVIAVLWTTLAGAQLAVPPLTGHVVDQTGTLAPDQQARIEQRLVAFEASKGSQIAVLLVADTAPETVEQYALRVAEKWKLGRKKIDDGVILLVAKNSRQLRIEVGYGLEGALNDAVSKRIIEETIVPRFRQQDFAGGIGAGVDQIMAVASGEALPPPVQRGQSGPFDADGALPTSSLLAMGVLLVTSLVLRSLLGAAIGALVVGGLTLGVAWWWTGVLMSALIAAGVAFMVTLLGVFNLLNIVMSARGGGGGRSGGFGGGGGGFGGGGASGRW